MGGKFTLDSAGLAPLAEIHSQVATGLSQLTGEGAPRAADVAKTFGNIAFSVNDALDGVTQSRGNTLQATKGSSDTIAELLGKADKLYAQGDQEGAAKLRAAAETLEGSDGEGGAAGAGGATGAGGAAAGGPGAGAAGGGGADMAGQMASQVGQQVGQLAQGVAQTVQGLAQGLTQLPQQIMQGIQGMAGSGSDTEALAKAAEEKADADKVEDTEQRKREEAEKRAEEDRAEQRPPIQADGALPGRSADAGPAPVPPPAPERPQPAQTRPQQFSP
jgi:hypothetical protein